MRILLVAAFLFLVVIPAPSRAQFGDPAKVSPGGTTFGAAKTQRWKVGVVVTARGPCFGIFGTVPVPSEWPEQQVRVVEEEITANVGRVRYRTLDGGVKQMLVSISRLNAGETAKALVTFEVTKRAIVAPTSTTELVIPSRIPRELAKFIGNSPYIETRNAKIRALAREVVEGKEGAWQQVEAIYDWVRDNIKYENGQIKGAIAALEDGTGDCEELTSLFIALCRVNKIPARTVWVPDHCYPEFYLEDGEGHGHWFPCQAAGARDFGGMPDQRPVLQKGDRFQVPEQAAPQRYVAEFLKIRSVKGGGQPSIEFVRDLQN